MEENRNTDTAAAAESVIDSIKKLMDAVGNDDALKRKLEEALAALAEEPSGRNGDAENRNPPEPAPVAEEEEDEDEEDDDAEEVENVGSGAVFSPGTDLSDIFNEDAIAGMVVGFIAGAAVVGGGVLLHKVLSDN